MKRSNVTSKLRGMASIRHAFHVIYGHDAAHVFLIEDQLEKGVGYAAALYDVSKKPTVTLLFLSEFHSSPVSAMNFLCAFLTDKLMETVELNLRAMRALPLWSEHDFRS